MTINRIYKRLDIKEIAISKLEKSVQTKLKFLKTDNIFFEKPIGEIFGISYKYGYFTLVGKDAKTMFPQQTKGYLILEIIRNIDSNSFFSYIETSNGKHIKVKPRKNAKLQLPIFH